MFVVERERCDNSLRGQRVFVNHAAESIATSDAVLVHRFWLRQRVDHLVV
jgi:hypothetical protein